MDAQIKKIFNDAQQNIAKGDVLKALSCCNKIIDQGKKFPEIYRMCGYIDMYNGNYESAFENYKTAINIAENKEIYIFDLMVAYIESNEPEKAIEYAASYDLKNNDNLNALICCAFLKKDDKENFVNYYKKILSPNSESPFLYQLKSTIAMQSGNFDAAIQYCQATLKLKPDYVDAYLNIQSCLMSVNKPANAVIALQKALNIRPVNKVALKNIINLSRKLDISHEALPYVKKALSLNLIHPPLYLFMALFHQSQKEFEIAIEYCDKSIKSDTNFISAYNIKSRILERLGRLDEAIKTAKEGLKIDNQHSNFYETLAVIKSRQGKYDEAYEYCEKADKLNNIESVRYEILSIKANILDKKGQYREAFSDFSKVQSGLRNIWNAKAIKTNDIFNDKIEKYYTKETISKWNGNDYKEKSPVFFMGFPRSGTTLVEAILSSHSGNLVSSEEESINHMSSKIAEILNNTAFQYPHDLDTLSIEQLDKLRDYYWKIMQTTAFKGKKLENKCIIDKYPMNIVHLGFIYRLFPNAKVIFAIRDPRDVCLSCFFQNFKHNAAMSHFYTMDDTVKFYDNIMDLYLKLRDTVPLDIKEYRYEDLVENQEKVLKDLFKFIGQPWEESVMEYYKKKRNVNTPSYKGIDKPIYKTAMKRWKNYESELRPCLPKLERYVKEFGYEDS